LKIRWIPKLLRCFERCQQRVGKSVFRIFNIAARSHHLSVDGVFVPINQSFDVHVAMCPAKPGFFSLKEMDRFPSSFPFHCEGFNVDCILKGVKLASISWWSRQGGHQLAACIKGMDLSTLKSKT
jgi:hypothetical protein